MKKVWISTKNELPPMGKLVKIEMPNNSTILHGFLATRIIPFNIGSEGDDKEVYWIVNKNPKKLKNPAPGLYTTWFLDLKQVSHWEKKIQKLDVTLSLFNRFELMDL